MKAHHGSIAREQRLEIEDALKRGRAPRRSWPRAQPRARHRHGRGRPRDPGRVAGLGGARAAAHRPRRPPGRRAEPGQDLPEVPRRPARGGGRRRTACAAGLVEETRYPRNPLDVLAQQIVADVRGRRVGRRRARRVVRRAAPLRRPVRRRVHRRARPARRALPVRRVRRACGRASCGTAPTVASGPATARGGSPSPTAARSPTAGCSACSSPDGHARRRARRGDGVRVAGPATRSCSARPPGASRTSPATA